MNSGDSNTLVEKYRPAKYTDFMGREDTIKEIELFLKNYPKKKALILHGPAGTGKTSLVLAAAREHGYEVLELNASDLRNRQKLEDVLKPATEQMSLFKKGKILLMDEVDGVTGTDIGGIPELVRLIRGTRHPMIMTCNDVWQSKLSPVRAESKILEIKAMDLGTIVSVLARISEKEAYGKQPQFLKQIAIKAQGDLRAAINDLESYAYRDDITVDITEKRDVEQTIFVILRQLFKERHDNLELFDNSELSLDEILLWIEENIPKEYANEALVKAYYALSNADVFRGRIYRNQSWRFLIYQNIFQSAGVSYAKIKANEGFTKYERPKRILKIWLHNQKIVQKKTIAQKYAHYVHCSMKRVMRDFDVLVPILRDEHVQQSLRLSEEEIEFIKTRK